MYKFPRIFFPSSLLVLASLNAVAANSDLKMSMSLGLQHRDVSVSDPVAPYKSRGTSANATLSRQLDAVTMGSLSLSYSLDHSGATTQQINGEIIARSASLSLSRYIGGGRIVQDSLSYGRSALDNLSSGVSYRTKGDSLVGGIGIIQFIPLGKDGSGTIGLNYARVLNHIENYVDSTGTHTNGQAIGSHAISLSGGLRWQLGKWTPSISLSANNASKDMSLSDSDRTSLAWGLGLGYALGRDRSLNVSCGAVSGLKNVRDRTFGVNLAFPL